MEKDHKSVNEMYHHLMQNLLGLEPAGVQDTVDQLDETAAELKGIKAIISDYLDGKDIKTVPDGMTKELAREQLAEVETDLASINDEKETLLALKEKYGEKEASRIMWEVDGEVNNSDEFIRILKEKAKA